jgi:hypothetical protein
MFTAQDLRPVDAATAEERLAHLPLEGDRWTPSVYRVEFDDAAIQRAHRRRKA